MKSKLNKRSLLIIFSIVYIGIMVIAIGVDVLVMPYFIEDTDTYYDDSYDTYSPEEDDDWDDGDEGNDGDWDDYSDDDDWEDDDWDDDDWDDDDSDFDSFDAMTEDEYGVFDADETDEYFEEETDDWITEDDDSNDENVEDTEVIATESDVSNDDTDDDDTDDDDADDDDDTEDDDSDDDVDDIASNKSIINEKTVTTLMSNATTSVADMNNDSKNSAIGRFTVKIEGAHLNIRKKPTITEKVTGQLNNGESGIVVEKGDEWSLILSDSGKAGYVRNDMIVITQ